MKTALFIDRDGTILVEPADEQIDSFSKLKFTPGVFRNLSFIREKLDFEQPQAPQGERQRPTRRTPSGINRNQRPPQE